VPEARVLLKEEIATFAARFGPMRSVCPHGDSRVPGVSNRVLMRDQEWTDFGVELDSNDAMRRHELGAWLTDRSSADGRWAPGLDPDRLLADGAGPILCVTHPNNWVSGPGLWADRLVAAALPAWRLEDGGRRLRPVRTGDDAPPEP